MQRRTFIKLALMYGKVMFVILPFVAVHLTARLMRITVGVDSNFWPTTQSSKEWIVAIGTAIDKFLHYDINDANTAGEHELLLWTLVEVTTWAIILALIVHAIVWLARHRRRTVIQLTHP